LEDAENDPAEAAFEGAEVRDLLGTVRDRASFVAPHADPRAAWWQATLSEGT
jgi:hypothetical protein